jgi:hypothetical protein
MDFRVSWTWRIASTCGRVADFKEDLYSKEADG